VPGLENEEGYQKLLSLIGNHNEASQNKIKLYFPSLSTEVYDWISVKEEYPVDDELRVCLSRVQPRSMYLCRKKKTGFTLKK
jgi:hypothetical protein